MPIDSRYNAGDIASAELPSVRHVVIILTDSEWGNVKRIASQEFRSPVSSWLVLFVKQTDTGGSKSALGRIHDTAFLAERAGAKVVVGDFDDVVEGIGKLGEIPTKVLLVRDRGFTGEFKGWLFQKRLKRSIGETSVRSVGIKSALVDFTFSPKPTNQSATRLILDAAGVIALVAISAYVSWIAKESTPAGFSMLVMLACVVVAASVFGRWAGVFAATLSMLTLKLFFFMPIGTIRIDRVQDILLLFVFLIVGGAMSLLTGRSADRLRIAREQQIFSESMFRMARKLAESNNFDDIAQHLSIELGEPLDAKVFLLDCRGAESDLSEKLSTLINHDVLPDDMRALQYAIETNEHAGYGTSVANETIFHFQPVSVGRQSLAVIVVSEMVEEKLNDPKLRVLIETVADLCGISLERLFAAEEMEEVKANEASERLRATVLSSLSHDFRTPLSTIIGSTTSLQQFRTKYDAETVEELLSNIYSAANRLDRFVGEILELSKLQDEELISKSDPVDFVDVVETVAEAMQPTLSNFRIKRSFDHPIPLVMGDSLLLEQVLQNFLENATKYSAANTTITLSLQKKEEEVLFGVSDKGIGVSPENLDRIFERSFRVSSVPTEDRSAGLGLSICAEIARLHGGRVWAESDGLGKGTTFFFSMPVGNIVNFEPLESIA